MQFFEPQKVGAAVNLIWEHKSKIEITGAQLSLAREKSVNRSRKLVPSVEEFEFEDEEEAHELAAHLVDHLAGSVGRAT